MEPVDRKFGTEPEVEPDWISVGDTLLPIDGIQSRTRGLALNIR
jgi:hypothetical protein